MNLAQSRRRLLRLLPFAVTSVMLCIAAWAVCSPSGADSTPPTGGAVGHAPAAAAWLPHLDVQGDKGAEASFRADSAALLRALLAPKWVPKEGLWPATSRARTYATPRHGPKSPYARTFRGAHEVEGNVFAVTAQPGHLTVSIRPSPAWTPYRFTPPSPRPKEGQKQSQPMPEVARCFEDIAKFFVNPALLPADSSQRQRVLSDIRVIRSGYEVLRETTVSLAASPGDRAPMNTRPAVLVLWTDGRIIRLDLMTNPAAIDLMLNRARQS